MSALLPLNAALQLFLLTANQYKARAQAGRFMRNAPANAAAAAGNDDDLSCQKICAKYRAIVHVKRPYVEDKGAVCCCTGTPPLGDHTTPRRVTVG